jgi:CheY-like chemotaxis protein
VADIGMPDEDGFAFIQKVRARPGRDNAVPAIALTAWGLPRDRDRAAEAGFQAHLVKPIDPPSLVSLLVSLVRKG